MHLHDMPFRVIFSHIKNNSENALSACSHKAILYNVRKYNYLQLYFMH